MTDKEKLGAIRAEIHRLVDVRGYDREMANDLFAFMDSLPNEPVSEDLEKAAEEYIEYTPRYDIGYELEEGNDPTEIDCFTIDEATAAFIEGAKWQKEQMIAKAIEAVISQVPCSNEIILYNPSSVDRYYLPQEMNKLGLNKGDKVKLIIIKED